MSNLTLPALTSEAASPKAETGEIKPLTGIRGFAAALVVLGHFHLSWTILLPGLRRLDPLSECGGLGVDLFFILSGFILCYVYKGRPEQRFGFPEYRRFLWLRFSRIWPNHFVMLAVLAVMVILAKAMHKTLTGDYPVGGIPFQLAMVHAWPGVPYGPWGWNYPSWSISAEWFAYVFVFPVAWHVLNFKAVKPMVWLVLSYSFLLLFLFGLAPLFLGGTDPIPKVTCEFFAGAMLFNTWRRSAAITRACQKFVSPVVIILLLWMCLVPKENKTLLSLISLLFPLLLLGLTSEGSAPARFLSLPPILWLGRVSYALYMSHGIIQKLAKILLPSERFQDAALAIRLAIIFGEILAMLLSATALYYMVEVPSRHYLRQFAAFWTSRSRPPKPINPG